MTEVNNTQYGVRELMRPAIFIPHTATLREVLAKMIDEKRNSLTVIDDEGKFVGAINAIDVIKAVVPDYLEEDAIAARFADIELLKQDAERVQGMPVTEFMATDIPTISPDDNALRAAVMAAQMGRGRITVVDEDGKPIGVLTRTEIKQVIGSMLGLSGDRFA